MRDQIRESDWKILRDLKQLALERLCERILGEIAAVAIATSRGAHERYLDVFELIGRRNREIANAFDDLRRSNAIIKLATMRSYGLLTDEEFQRFSDETREIVERIVAPDPD
jgi:hypothetical protein